MPRVAPTNIVTPDAVLAAIIGSAEPIARTAVLQKICQYIHANGAQDANKRQQINADQTLRPFFDGRDHVSMFELGACISKHVTKS